jgi:putative membrane protein
MRALIGFTLAALVLVSGPAAAHNIVRTISDEPVGWSFELAVWLPLTCSAALYIVGASRLWLRSGSGRGLRRREMAVFATGWAVLVGAMVSPLHALSGRLFTAHMIEHELLMAVAAPLLVLAHPLGTLLWGLPKSWRLILASLKQKALLAWLWSWVTKPVVATIVHGIAIWAWHAPTLFREALLHEWIHRLQHGSLLVTGLVFWWSIIRCADIRHAQGICHLFTTSMHTSLLGAILVFSPRPWFDIQSVAAAAWGLTSLEDQQLAGLIMWIPGGLIYAGAALWLAGTLIVRAPDPAADIGSRNAATDRNGVPPARERAEGAPALCK